MVQSFEKVVADKDTPEPLLASSRRVSWATIQSKATNTKPVQIIAPTAAAVGGYTIASGGDSLVLWSTAINDQAIDLAKVFAKVGADGEGVDVIYVA